MGHILVLSGAGRYADNIHDFDATSEAVSQVLTERGHQVEVRRSYPEALDHLAGADLLLGVMTHRHVCFLFLETQAGTLQLVVSMHSVVLRSTASFCEAQCRSATHRPRQTL